jgi:sporulation protein YqfC
MKRKKQNKIDKILELPKEVYTNVPKIVITGFDEMIVENFKGILEYEEFFVQIKTYIGIININGYGLTLENMTNDDIKVKGKIESMDIERVVEEN